jgi:hypothetical protein
MTEKSTVRSFMQGASAMDWKLMLNPFGKFALEPAGELALATLV